MSHGYKFYIQRVEKLQDGTYSPVPSTIIDLESRFKGLKYSKLTGLNDIGKAKNIYTEKYADGDKLRVYIPQTIQSEATSMTLTIYFFGKDRQSVFADFANEIKSGIHRYWDTARNMYFDFFVDDELKPTDENWYKGEPYFKVDVKMKNIYGRCHSRLDTNLLIDGDKTLNNDKHLLGSYNLGSIRPADGELVKLTFSGYISVTNDENKVIGYDKLRVYNSGWNVPLVTTITQADYNVATSQYEVEFNWVVGDSSNEFINFYQTKADNSALLDEDIPEGYRKGQSLVSNVKLEIVKVK